MRNDLPVTGLVRLRTRITKFRIKNLDVTLSAFDWYRDLALGVIMFSPSKQRCRLCRHPLPTGQIFPQKSDARLVAVVQEAAGPAAVQAPTPHSGAQIILFVNLVLNPPLNKVRRKSK